MADPVIGWAGMEFRPSGNPHLDLQALVRKRTALEDEQLAAIEEGGLSGLAMALGEELTEVAHQVDDLYLRLYLRLYPPQGAATRRLRAVQ